MPLYDPDRTVVVAPEDAVRVVHSFLVRCRDWARDREIPRRMERVRQDLDPIEAGTLHAWVAWMRFCEHAMTEIEEGTLDHWFTATPPERVE